MTGPRAPKPGGLCPLRKMRRYPQPTEEEPCREGDATGLRSRGVVLPALRWRFPRAVFHKTFFHSRSAIMATPKPQQQPKKPAAQPAKPAQQPTPSSPAQPQQPAKPAQQQQPVKPS